MGYKPSKRREKIGKCVIKKDEWMVMCNPVAVLALDSYKESSACNKPKLSVPVLSTTKPVQAVLVLNLNLSSPKPPSPAILFVTGCEITLSPMTLI